MFEAITSTPTSSALSFGNITSAITATTVAEMFDNNSTEFWNASADYPNTTPPFDPCHPSNPDFNCSEEDFLNFRLGAKRMPLETAIWVSFMINYQIRWDR